LVSSAALSVSWKLTERFLSLAPTETYALSWCLVAPPPSNTFLSTDFGGYSLVVAADKDLSFLTAGAVASLPA